MRYVWLVVGTLACQFTPGTAPELRPDDAALPPGDAGRDAGPDATPDAALPTVCDPADPALVACYPFDGNATDVSGNGLNPTTANITFVAGRLGQAMAFTATSAADVPEDARFGTVRTIEAWIRPDALPAAGLRQGVVDNQNEWGFFLHEGGNMRCLLGGNAQQTSGTVGAGQWHHVACTYDGTQATVYVDGQIVAQAAGSAPGTGGTSGISLAADNPPGAGSRLIGQIDEVRLYDVARPANDICRDAGLAACP